MKPLHLMIVLLLAAPAIVFGQTAALQNPSDARVLTAQLELMRQYDQRLLATQDEPRDASALSGIAVREAEGKVMIMPLIIN